MLANAFRRSTCRIKWNSLLQSWISLIGERPIKGYWTFWMKNYWATKYSVSVCSMINYVLFFFFPNPEPCSHHPPNIISLGHPCAPALTILYPASNLDWWFVSYMILYMFQCHSPKSSHPLPLPQSPKDCSIHLCLFCCLAYRVIVIIFLNSIYMH